MCVTRGSAAAAEGCMALRKPEIGLAAADMLTTGVRFIEAAAGWIATT